MIAPMTDCYRVVYTGGRYVDFPYTVQGLANAALEFSHNDIGVFNIVNPNRIEWSDQRMSTDSGLNDAELEYLSEVWGIIC